jgi:hypothetical protein
MRLLEDEIIQQSQFNPEQALSEAKGAAKDLS